MEMILESGGRRLLFHALMLILGLPLLMTGCKYRKEFSDAELLAATNSDFFSTPVQPVAAEPANKVCKGDLGPFVVSAKASSIENAQSQAQLAFDGVATSRWSSLFRDGEWLEGYFDRTVGVERIEISWEVARAADFEILLLNKNSEWIEVSRRVNDDSMVDSLEFSAPMKTRGIRIHCTRRSTQWGSSILEVKMSGVAFGAPPSRNLIGWRMPMDEYAERERLNTQQLLAAAGADPTNSSAMTDDEFLDLVERRSFDYFWYETNPSNGLTRDRGHNFKSSEGLNMCSVAAVGFALTAYAIGAERGWVSRTDAVKRVRVTLQTFDQGPIRNVKGLFPHFVDYFTCADMPGTEVSTIDTALLLAGMIVAMEYFQDAEISNLSRKIIERVDWDWARNGDAHFVVHGIAQDGKFLDAKWGSFTEGLLIYLIAAGSPTHPLPMASWDANDRHLDEYEGYRFACEYGFQSIFRYQYPALWFDFRGVRDRSGLDYFENVTIATLAMRQYCLRQVYKFPGSYGPDLWGQGAADGPGNRYMIYGFPPGEPYSPPDGTVIPYAMAGSMPFTPQLSIRGLRYLYDQHHNMWGKYGFADAVNPMRRFVARDVIGLDAGAMFMGIENYRSGRIWDLFMRNEWIRKTAAQLQLKRIARPSDPDGPIDLARTCVWKFQPGGGELQAPSLSDDAWNSIMVPDRWENQDARYAKLDGAAWYRVRFQMTPEKLRLWGETRRPVTLRMGGVDDGDRAYIDGVLVGSTMSGSDVYRQPRNYTVPLNLLHTGTNVLAVYVYDTKDMGGIWLPPVEIGPEPKEIPVEMEK
ncbi:MAG: glucoamylase family protein [Lentisphaerota bacterium]